MFASLLLLALLSPPATIEGWVRAEGDRAPIPGAVVQIPALGRSVQTDERGAFVLPNVPEGSWTLRVRAMGYRTHHATVGVPREGTVRLEFVLEAEPVPVEPVNVKGRARPPSASAVEAGSAAGPAPMRVDAAVVERMPSLAEPDVLRAVQMLPSVQAASDFSSALYVRGGRPDQNLLMLDGAPLFNPFHLGGLFSAFDPSAIESVELLPGGFPARVGDRLSSAIDIRTREGNRDRVRGAGAIGLISSRLGLDGPLPGGRGSYLLSARRTYLDVFTDAAQAIDVMRESFPYAFTDAHLKLTHDVGRLGRLSATFYLDGEGFRYPESAPTSTPPTSSDRAAFDWGSRLASLHYSQRLGTGWVAEGRAGVSDFHGSFLGYSVPWDDGSQTYRSDSTETFLDARTLQRDVFAAVDLTGSAAGHTQRLGVQLDRYLLDHDVGMEGRQLDGVILPFARSDRPATVAAYAEDEWRATDDLSVRGGLRVLHAGAYGTEWLPRLGARYTAGEHLAFSVGASRSAQVLRSLRSEESIWSSLTAYDLISAVPAESGLSTAQDVTLGVEWSRPGTSLRVDAYSKWTRNLPLAPLPDDIMKAPIFAPDSVWIGSGTARGLEVLARHAVGQRSFSLSYALTFAELDNGVERYTPRFERRHLLDASVSLPLGRTGVFTSRLAWGTGQPYTPVLGATQPLYYDPATGRFWPPGGYRLLVGEHNGARLPGYFRLDVGARTDITRRWWGREVTLTPYVSVLNVLNTSNVLFAMPEEYPVPRLEYPPQLPIFPTFGLEWRF